MLTLKTLIFSGIGRFVDEQTVDFTVLTNLAQVEGKNENTKGSSGAGKSTIFKALEYLLGLNNIPTTVLQSRLTKEPINVIGIFDYDGKPLKIQRGKKFLIDSDGTITTGNAKTTEAELSKILGMSSDLFRKILHKRQKEGGFFLNMAPGDIHKFFTSCLGLEDELKKVAIVELDIADLTKKIASAESGVASSQSGLQATLDAEKYLNEPKCSVDEETVSRLRETHDSATQYHDGLLKTHREQISALEVHRPKLTSTPFDRSQIVTLELEVSKIQKEITSLEQAERDRVKVVNQRVSEERGKIYDLKTKVSAGARAQTDAQAAAQELNKIREALCPTCEQNWATEAAKAKEALLVDKLKGYKALVIAGNKAQAGLVELEAAMVALTLEVSPRPVDTSALSQVAQGHALTLATLRKEEQVHNQKETQKNQALIQEFNQKMSELRKSHEESISGAYHHVKEAQSSYVSAQNEWNGFAVSHKKYLDSVEQIKFQKEKYSKHVTEVSALIEKHKEDLEIANEGKKLIKSYLSASFEDALESIGETATRLVRGIPNMSTATVQLEGLKETQEGKVKEEINAILHMDGELGIPIKSLSGGEASSTDLAIDLAVEQFIEERTGKGTNIKILDEPFDGLDFECSSNALEMLKTCNIGKTILIVDHNPILKEQIDSRIVVVRSGNTSRVVQ